MQKTYHKCIVFRQKFFDNTLKKIKKKIKKINIIEKGSFPFLDGREVSVLFSTEELEMTVINKCGRFDRAHLCC